MDTAWSIVATNLPEHANNPIHTDAGAQAAGFERALVAGVTSYAYSLHPVIARFGDAWVTSGSAEVRFRSPVFDGDVVSFPVVARGDGGIDVAAVVTRVGRPLVEVSAWSSHDGEPDRRDGEVIEPVEIELVGEYGSGYARRAGDVTDPCAARGVVHPAVWAALANQVFRRHLVRGAWIHTRSHIRHHGTVRDDAVATLSTTVVDRFASRLGERAVADIRIEVDGRLVATVEHEAIIALT